MQKRNPTGLSALHKTKKAPKGICALGEGSIINWLCSHKLVSCQKQCKRLYGKGARIFSGTSSKGREVVLEVMGDYSGLSGHTKRGE